MELYLDKNKQMFESFPSLLFLREKTLTSGSHIQDLSRAGSASEVFVQYSSVIL